MGRHHNLPAMFRRASIRGQLGHGPPFKSVAAVTLTGTFRYREAVAFAKGPDMMQRCVQTNANFDKAVRWDFESIEDAVLFRLKFDGKAARPTDLEQFITTGQYK